MKTGNDRNRHVLGAFPLTVLIKMRILFIINPHAGSHTVDEFNMALAHSLEHLAGEMGNPPETEQLVPETRERLRSILRERLTSGDIDVVGVVGGDGTIMEVLPVMVDFPAVRMALIPFG